MALPATLHKLGRIDPDQHDEALTGCVNACWAAGIVDAASVVATGIALIVWGLSIHSRDNGGRDIPALRRDIKRAIDEAGVVSLRPDEAA